MSHNKTDILRQLKDKKYFFTLGGITTIPDTIYGNYALWFHERCLYVGKAKEQPIYKRLLQHYGDCRNKTLKNWLQSSYRHQIQFAIADFTKGDPHIDNMEEYAIRQLQPETNHHH